MVLEFDVDSGLADSASTEELEGVARMLVRNAGLSGEPAFTYHHGRRPGFVTIEAVLPDQS